MKKLFILSLFLLISPMVFGQFLNFGFKGGVNYNVNGDLRAAVTEIDLDSPVFKSSEEVGYHIGMLAEIKLPLFLYIRPELVYTHTESSYKSEAGNTKLKMDKLDLPVLVGFRVLKIGRFFFGPNFQYIMSQDLSTIENIDNITKVSADDFIVSGQIGIGIDIGKFGADVRWETGFTDSEANFIGDIGELEEAVDLNVDTSAQQFILSFYFTFK